MAPALTLSPRRQQVLDLILSGKSTQEIADQLVVSIKTAECHATVLLHLHGCHSRAELVARVLGDRIEALERRNRELERIASEAVVALALWRDGTAELRLAS